MFENRLNGMRKCPIFEVIVLVFFSAYYILTSFYSSFNFLIITALMIVYLCYLMLLKEQNARTIAVVLILVVLVAVAYTLLTDTSTINASGLSLKIKQLLSKFYQYLTMYFPVVLFIRFSTVMNEKQKKSVLLVIGFLIGYVIFQTLQELSINPNAIRQWESGVEIEDDNIGGYYFVYSIPIIIGTVLSCANKVDWRGKIVATVLVITLLYFLVRAQYTLALLISIIVIIAQLFFLMKNIGLKLVLLFIGILLLFFLPNLLLWFANSTSSFQMSVRFRELYAFFADGDASGYNLSSRLNVYQKTLIAFFQSPLWGHRHLDFDGHATYLTVLSDTGLIGSIPFYCLLVKSIKVIRQGLEPYAKNITPIIIGLFCMGLTNPIHSSLPLSFAVWFVAPFAIDYFYRKGDGII